MSDPDDVTILVVDDEQIVLSLMRRLFERQGYRVLTAPGGAEAIELYREHCRLLRGVILDLSMPQMSGKETFDCLCDIRGDVPIILTSGFNEDESLERFGTRPVAGFIQKPFRPQEILDKVEELLDLSSEK